MRIPLEMGEAEPQQLVIVPQILIVALKEVAVRMKGHMIWLTILKTYPITKAANTVTYEMTLIVTFVVRICGIGLMSAVLDAPLYHHQRFTEVQNNLVYQHIADLQE